MVHFLASMLLVVDAVVLVHRSNRDYGPRPGTPARAPPILLLGGRALLGAAGPRARRRHRHHRRRPARRERPGPAGGQAHPDRAARHGRAALEPRPAAGRASTLGLAVALHAMAVPERVRTGAPGSCVVVLVAQAAVGYTQYFTHLPALLSRSTCSAPPPSWSAPSSSSCSFTHHPAGISSVAPVRPVRPAPGRQPPRACPATGDRSRRDRIQVVGSTSRPATGPHRLAAQDAALSRR